MHQDRDTIVAQATAPGKASVGIVRVSGPLAKTIANKLLGKQPAVRQAQYLPFFNHNGVQLDQGIAILFQAPHSFTGEDVLELQGHGGQLVMDLLLREITQIPGVRQAKPGEFSERAFLNDKIDLTQAEAIADLIEASSEQAARSAMRSLQGEFSRQIDALVEKVIHLRMYVEAAIDFPEEEIDFLSDGKITSDLDSIITHISQVLDQAKQGSLLREGMKVVIAGKPNAGKSSLLNALAGKNTAIVTDIAGTTRDVLKEHIHINGMPLHIIDTAGLRDSPDKVEQIGIQRAWEEIEQADRILFMLDATETTATDPRQIWPEFANKLPADIGLTVIRNKIDLCDELPAIQQLDDCTVINLSAQRHDGLDILRQHLAECMGLHSTVEGQFSARRRHIDAIDIAQRHIVTGQQQLELNMAGELLAEELRLAQQQLNEITGEFTSDDLLGKIFSSFCIGK